MDSPYSLYIVTNVVNGMQYVGLSKSLKQRMAGHKCAASKSALHVAIKEHGFDKFVFSHIADAFDLSAACRMERMLIEQHNTLTPNGYNQTVGGQVGPVGYKHSAETKKKLSDANRMRGEVLKERFRLSKKGVKQTDAFRANASEKMKKVWAMRKAAKSQVKNLLIAISTKEQYHGF